MINGSIRRFFGETRRSLRGGSLTRIRFKRRLVGTDLDASRDASVRSGAIKNSHRCEFKTHSEPDGRARVRSRNLLVPKPNCQRTSRPDLTVSRALALRRFDLKDRPISEMIET